MKIHTKKLTWACSWEWPHYNCEKNKWSHCMLSMLVIMISEWIYSPVGHTNAIIAVSSTNSIDLICCPLASLSKWLFKIVFWTNGGYPLTLRQRVARSMWIRLSGCWDIGSQRSEQFNNNCCNTEREFHNHKRNLHATDSANMSNTHTYVYLHMCKYAFIRLDTNLIYCVCCFSRYANFIKNDNWEVVFNVNNLHFTTKFFQTQL